MIHGLIHGGYNIAPALVRAANARGNLEATSTGGGCDYIIRYIGQYGRVYCKADESYLYAFKHNGAGVFTKDKSEVRAAKFQRDDKRVQSIIDDNLYVWQPDFEDCGVLVLGGDVDATSPDTMREGCCVTLYLDNDDWAGGGYASFTFENVSLGMDFMSSFTKAVIEQRTEQ